MTMDEFMNSLPTGRCNPCKYARCVVATGQYSGKWVREINDCPKKERESE